MRPSNYASGGAHRVKEHMNLHRNVTAFDLAENPRIHLTLPTGSAWNQVNYDHNGDLPSPAQREGETCR